MRISHRQINKIVLIVTTIIILISLSWTAYFIYDDVYKIIILVPTLSDLQMQVSFDLVRVDLFKGITDASQSKMVAREINWLNIHNPF